MPDIPPTLREIATAAGCSHVTVSRALRGAAGVNPERAEEIGIIAERLGYRANPLVSAWMSAVRKEGRRNRPAVAYLSAFSPEEYSEHFPTAESLAGARELADRRGYDLVPVHLCELSARHPERTLLARGVQGVVLGPAPYGYPQPRLDWSRLCVVALGLSFSALETDRVISHSYKVIRDMLSECALHGHCRPALVIERGRDDRLSNLATASFLQWNHAKGKPRPGLLIRHWEKDPGAFIDWWRKQKPDALITPEWKAVEALAEAEDGQGSASAYKAYLGSEMATSADAVFTPDFRRLGALAMEHLDHLLIRNLRGLPAEPRIMTVPCVRVK